METIKGPAAQGSIPEVLRVARAKIAQGWCRFTEAIDAAGHDRSPDAPDAVAWCSNGALWVAEPGEEQDAYNRRREARRFILEAIGRPTLSDWNDEVAASKSEVLAAFDRAIALAVASEQPPAGPSASPASPTSTDEGDGNA